MVLTLKEKLDAGDYEFVLISHTYPSGVSWLMNVLLELDICIDMKVDEHENFIWDFIDDQTAVTARKPGMFHLDPRVVAVTAKKNTFSFRENFYIPVSHDTAYTYYLDKKVILMVRDPRDAIHSSYNNKCPEHEMSFHDFLLSQVENFTEISWLNSTLNFWITRNQNTSFKQVFEIADRWAVWTALWLRAIPPENLLVIRFEDTKTDDFKEARKVLDFIKVNRTNEEINQAVKESTFEKAKSYANTYKKNERIRFRKGQPGEWKNIYTEQDLRLFNGFTAIVMNTLGYNDSNPSNQTLDSFSQLVNRLKTIKTRKLDKFISFLDSLENVDSDDNNIPKQFFAIYTKFFYLRNMMNNQLKIPVAKVFLALVMTIIYIKNNNKIDFENIKITKAESKIFKALIVIFDKMSLNELNHVIAKSDFPQFSIVEFLAGIETMPKIEQ